MTGCSSGLGAALASSLAAVRHPASGEPAYRVFATARRPEALEALKAAGAETLALDVGSDASVAAAVAAVLAAAGRVDVLINNAGLSRKGPLAEQALEEVQQIFDTNVMGVLRVTQVREQGGRRGGRLWHTAACPADPRAHPPRSHPLHTHDAPLARPVEHLTRSRRPWPSP